MADERVQWAEVSLHYDPGYLLNPEDLLSFIESPFFTSAWRRCRLTDADLFELQVLIMTDPKFSPVVKGSGGLRKMRFAPTGAAEGKSGSHRACYVYFEEAGIVFLVTAYSKGRQDNLSPAALKLIRRMIREQEELLERGPIL
jgi:hypothetical protein